MIESTVKYECMPQAPAQGPDVKKLAQVPGVNYFDLTFDKSDDEDSEHCTESTLLLPHYDALSLSSIEGDAEFNLEESFSGHEPDLEQIVVNGNSALDSGRPKFRAAEIFCLH